MWLRSAQSITIQLSVWSASKGSQKGGGCHEANDHSRGKFFATYPAAATSNVLEQLAVAVTQPGQLKILVNNWYLPPETSNFLQRVGFSDSNFKTELQQFDHLCRSERPQPTLGSSRQTHRKRRISRRDDAGCQRCPQSPKSHNRRFSTSDVTVVHESVQELCDWSPCDYLLIRDPSPSPSTCQLKR